MAIIAKEARIALIITEPLIQVLSIVSIPVAVAYPMKLDNYYPLLY